MKCWLVAVDHSHEGVELPDGVPVSVGRSPSTNITDTQVSRIHGVQTVCFIAISLRILCILLIQITLILE